MLILSKSPGIRSSLVITLMIVTGLFTGCKTKHEREKELEKEKADAAIQAQTNLETQKLSTARSELEDKLRIYNGISGEYRGYYLGYDDTQVLIKANISVLNALSDSQISNSKRESELIAARDALNLEIDVEESIESMPGRLFNCGVSGIKPDFNLGTIRVTCSSQSSNLSRTYVFGMDQVSNFDMETLNISSQAQRAKLTSADLLQNRIRTVENFGIRVVTTSKDYIGKIWRKSL